MKFFLYQRRKIIIVILIMLLTITFFLMYNKQFSKNISNYVYDILNKYVYNLVSSYYIDLIDEDTWKSILKTTKNEFGEILLVDFDIKEANKLNKTVTNKLNDYIDALSKGEVLDENLNIKSANKGFEVEVPFILNENYALLSNLTPKIPVKVSFIGSVKTNINTKVSSYGLNNSLAEIYVTTKIELKIYYPVYQDSYTLDYDVLLDSKLIQGRVPFYYQPQNSTLS